MLNNIKQGLEVFSLKELNEAIIQAISKKDERNHDIERIISLVCEQYGISKQNIKKKCARGVIQDARQMCFCLMHLKRGLPIRYIANNVFFCWANVIMVGVNRYKKANVKYKEDKIFVEVYKKLEAQL